MPVQFAPKQGSFGQTLGNVVGGGLNTLIEGKIKELNKETTSARCSQMGCSSTIT